ncbi:YfiR family protein [Frateuria sp. STR12]|uniref:YfiR family protein n=1 Tax=Frateuria hangzhouensis TaxID=2995589 RepID=UPI002260EF82|nr:YfiR family protein [Frateuria sp. STR12]MCX7514385.1 YfiR family protein [Frateuria sp. STR12]
MPRYALRTRAATWLARLAATRPRGAACLLVLLLACATCQASSSPRQQHAPSDVSLEYAVKATYLYKLAPFVNWPPTTFTSPEQPFRICVAGDDPFDDYLKQAVAGRSLGTHPFEVLRLQTLTPEVDCQIVFISRLPSQNIRKALDAVSGKPVLTVVDSTAPGEGGIVQFVIRSGRVRFVIDTGEAARNHLTINSKLLSLALAVREPS